jgi:ribose transport system substrate-binding protein
MRRTFLFALLSVVVLAFVVAGCGDDDDSNGGGGGSGSSSEASVDRAKELLAEDEKPVEFKDPGPPIEPGDELEGKTYFQIVNGLEFPFTQGVVKGAKDAAEELGMEVVVTDGAGSTSKAARLIDQAIGRDVDALAIYGFDDAALDAPIKEAEEAGIPVVMVASQDQAPVTDEQKERGIDGIASFSYSDAGRSAANWMVADSGGDVNAVVFDVPDIGASAAEKGAFYDQLEQLCPDCETSEVDSPLAQWQSGLPNQTTSAIQKDPDVNYLFPMYDGMVFSMIPAVNRINAQDRVQITTYNASEPLLADIKQGKPPMGSDIGGSTEWLGWALVDQGARLLLGEDAVDDVRVPNRTFTGRNMKDLDPDAGQEELYGADFRSGYMELWGR